MCPEWRDSFPTFEKWALENGFSPELTIDRIDNSKGYCPENCRWVTPTKNQANRAISIIFPDGRTTPEVARDLGMTAVAIRRRLKMGCTMEEAMNIKKGFFKKGLYQP